MKSLFVMLVYRFPLRLNVLILALTHGIPSFIQTVEVLLKESQIEGVIIANEFKQVSAQHHQALLQCLKIEELETGKTLSITYLPHEDFKLRTHQSKAIIRTGECTPYANVIFQTGVTF